MRKQAAAILAAVAVAATSACGSTSQPKPQTSDSESMPKVIHIGYQEIPNTEEIARAEGWPTANLKGAKVTYLPFNSGKDVITAMSSGSVDIAVIGSSPTSAAIAQGLKYEVIYVLDVEGANEALVVKANEGVHSLSDLKGKTVATPFGSTSAFSLFQALQQNGLSTNSMKVVDMEPQDMLAAWTRGNLDAGYVWEPTLAKMVQSGGKVLLTSGDLAKKGVVTADLLVARKSFAESYPRAVAAFIKANIQAYEYYKAHPSDAANVIAKAFAISRSEAKHDMAELIWLSPAQQLSKSYLGNAQVSGALGHILKQNADFLVQQKDLSTAPSEKVFVQSVQPKYLESANSAR